MLYLLSSSNVVLVSLIIATLHFPLIAFDHDFTLCTLIAEDNAMFTFQFSRPASVFQLLAVFTLQTTHLQLSTWLLLLLPMLLLSFLAAFTLQCLFIISTFIAHISHLNSFALSTPQLSLLEVNRSWTSAASNFFSHCAESVEMFCVKKVVAYC